MNHATIAWFSFIQKNPEQVFSNLLNPKFDVIDFNTIWLAELTYIKVGNKWCYLVTALDFARRKLVGWVLEIDQQQN
ncbi:hypothetical protein [Pectinatus frisingensis]|uniref:hypothetical protein n=1 Tax=Pectinatus frisingensis TaxID=865 RepID=UPI0018C6D594|nr:hypothetical protein [Pectinatus frisingensis]